MSSQHRYHWGSLHGHNDVQLERGSKQRPEKCYRDWNDYQASKRKEETNDEATSALVVFQVPNSGMIFLEGSQFAEEF
jgi:hypothetical protein